MAAPPVIKIAPPAKKRGAGSSTKVTLQEVVAAAQKAGIPRQFVPYFAAIVQQESGGNFDPAPNSAGAVGPAQVLNYPTPKPGEDLHAWAMGALLAGAKHFFNNLNDNPGSLDKAIAAYYTGQGNVDKFGVSGSYGQPTPRQYVDSVMAIASVGANYGGSATPQQKALQSGLVAQAKSTNSIYLTNTAQLAANEQLAKLELRNTNAAAQFAAAQAQLNDVYVAFTGKPATNPEIQAYLKKPVSVYQLKQDLANQPGFTNSPIYRQRFGQYDSVYKSVWGPGQTAPKQLVAYAIANDMDQTSFQDYLRRQPTYTQSQEYKQQAAGFMNLYQSVYGVPQQGDLQANLAIDQAVRQGWSSDQFNQYLRAQPAYTNSAEFKTANVNLAQRFGLISGTQPQVGTPPPPPTGPPPAAGTTNKNGQVTPSG